MAQRALASTLWFFAIWTIFANILGLFSLQSWLLVPVFFAALLAAGLICARQQTWADLFPILQMERHWQPDIHKGAVQTGPWRALWFCGACGLLLLGMAVQYKWTQLEPFWGLAVMIAIVGLWRSRADPRPDIQTSPSTTVPPWSLPLVFAVFVALYLLINVPDSDDSLYLAFAISARDATHIYAADSFFGLTDLPFAKSTYRLESYILLTSVVSKLFSVSAVTAAHLIVALFGLFFAASALVVICIAVGGVRWWQILCVYGVLTLAFAAPYATFGYHAIPRAFQGKAILIFAIVPLIVYLTVAAVQSGNGRIYRMLALAQIAALGLTANALFIAPLASAITGLAFLFCGPLAVRYRVLALAGTVAYPLLIGAYLMAFDPPSPSQIQDVGKLGGIFWNVGGTVTGHIVLLAVIGLAVAMPLLSSDFKLMSFYTLAVLITIFNPLLWPYWGAYVTGNVNYRLFYAVPIYFLMAIACVQISARLRGAEKAILPFTLIGMMFLPSSMLWRAGNAQTLLRVPSETYAGAQFLNRLGDTVLLAPEPYAAWIPTLEEARPVVMARRIDFVQRKAQFTPEDYAARLRLHDWINGIRPAYANLTADLDTLCVGQVAMPSQQAADRGAEDERFGSFRRSHMQDWTILTRHSPC